jgi:DNA polymerase-3 subunit alpha
MGETVRDVPKPQKEMAEFVHLNAHSSYSLLEAVPSIKALGEKAAEHGMPAIGVADTNNLFGSVEIGEKIADFGVQPIIGSGVSITMEKDNPNQLLADTGQITLLIQNEIGWRNLTKISSKASLNGDELGTPQVSFDYLISHAEGLICLTGSMREGLIGKLLAKKQIDEAEAYILKLNKTFGQNRLYIELQRHGLEEEIAGEPHLLNCAYTHNIPLVATNDVRYMDKDGEEAFNVMLGIGDSTTVSNPKRRKFSGEHYFKSPEEMLALFKDIPEATANTLAIAKRCAFKVPLGTYYMPQWIRAQGDERTIDQIMVDESNEGLKKRFDISVKPLYQDEAEIQAKWKEYNDRLDYEIGIITDMGFPGYFLITSDFIRWAKQHDIPVGPGRGSGAGSLVAWCLDITDIDPIPFELYFERFLNPERVSMPDFDIDFCRDRRGEVIDYVRRKYGDAAVSQIVTFGTLKAKACIRDVGRVMEMPYSQVNRVAAFIPEGPGNFSIASVMEDDERLKALYDDDEGVRHVLDIAMRLEGAYRHTSLHAAGVIIADRSIDEICPLYKDPSSPMPAIQLNMNDAEPAGLVKFDFLGLKTLTVIDTAMRFIRERGDDPKYHFDINLISLEDVDTFNLLKAGHTVGVFQVESRGMTDFLVRMEPDKFSYLSDVVALYRPGPLESGMTDDFIECRHGRQAAKYPHEELEAVLGETFGVPVYQEQVMRMAQVMAGYSLGGADMLRRAMGKKKPSEMAKHREIFAEGSAKLHKLSREESDNIFDLMANFAGYGFNKAHTVAYGWVSYQTAYIKTHFPLEFMAASMTLDSGNSDKILKFKRELERMKVPLLHPDINQSGQEFRVENGNAIRFALTALKGSGEDAIIFIEKERQEHGNYKDIYDFIERIPPEFMNRRQLEVLIKAGAFDSMDYERFWLFKNVDILLSYMQTYHKEKNSDQIGLFGGATEISLERPKLRTDVDKWDPFEALDMEQQAIGFYLSSHPLNIYGDELRAKRYLKEVANLSTMAHDDIRKAKIAAIIHEKRELKTKRGDRMAILNISDTSGQEEVAVFPKDYIKFEETIDRGRPVFMTIALGVDGERVRMNVADISDLESTLSTENALNIRLKDMNALVKLKEVWAKQDTGKTECKLSYHAPNVGEVVVGLNRPIQAGKRLMYQLESLSGVEVQ